MATIPLQLAQRRLDGGAVVQYPAGSPVGEAMQNFGDELSAVAERYKQRKEQQEAFDAEIVRRRLKGQIAQAEDEAVQNAPADGSGLHDAMYGQVDPRTGRVIKSGLFDELFDSTLPKVPESQRANFTRQKEVLRAAGSERMAARQQARRDEYEQAEWTKVDNFYTGSIAKSDPNDTKTFEAIRQNGFDFIGKISNPLARQAAEMAWRSNTAKALVQAMIAQDPKRAAEMLGAAPVAADGMGETVRAAMDTALPAKETGAVTKGDRVGKLTPDEMVAQAFRDDIAPEDRPALAQQARAADATRQVETRTSIGLAEQNAPAAIRDTGIYSGPIPTPEQFAALYGATEGARRFEGFNRTIDVSRQFHGMRDLSNNAVRAMVKDADPTADSSTSEEDKARHDAVATAADLTFKARQTDPGGYVRKAFANLDAAWNNLSKPEDYQVAIIGSIAAQQQLGFETIQPLPNSVAEHVVGKLKDKTQPQQDQDAELRNVLAALPTRAAREAVLGHLLQTSASQMDNSIANRSLRAAVADPMMLLDLANTVERGRSGANAELTNYIPTNQEWLGRLIAGDSERGSLWRLLAQKLVGSDGLGEDSVSVADFTPLGTSFALEKAGNAALEGNYGEALLNVAGAIPSGKLAAMPLQRAAGKIAKPWVEKLSIFSRRPAEFVEGGEALIRGVDAETFRFQQDLARSVSPRAPRQRTRAGEISDSAFDTALLGAMLARDSSTIKHAGAKVGWAKSKDYRKTFFDTHSSLNKSDYVVHHAVEQWVFDRYPGLFKEEELHSIENLRGIRKEFDINLHQKVGTNGTVFTRDTLMLPVSKSLTMLPKLTRSTDICSILQ
ncbi:hypothetical protein OHD62_23775 [Mesorhizobium sp. YC-39]|uniref:hypothetical protein n=1 Tax=unclassified Mesorhizobium TaxID=325217 RepID=UPI0021E833E8|nr:MULTISPECIES: hypothetical protein [unclassified Mesorhizobium]MCV3209246.1 hypothetical protein [Mesorhizobium sp. YC-2]MCV3231404.1 hypothetical protein [Mesorhizobium sp. YC-39]